MGWRQPEEVDDIMLAFPANVLDMMPPWEEIPEKFRRRNTEWNEIVRGWFYEGLPKNVKFYGVDGIDPEKAFRHCKAILGSHEPKHQHKEAAVAYLMSLWFKKIKNWRQRGKS